MADILSYSFIQNALIAALLSGLSCGIIGTYIVTRRLVFLSGGITHSSLGGIGIAYWAGLNTTAGALVFAVISAFGIDYLGSKGKLREDTAIGILWSLGMAIGVLFIFLTPGYAPNLMSFLFGNLLLTPSAYLVWLGAFDAVLVLIFALFYRIIFYTALDSSYAASQRTRTRAINLAMLILISVAIVLNIKTIGIVLLISMLTIPTAIAAVFFNRFAVIMAWASVIAITSTVAGLVLSYAYDIPSAAVSVIFLAALFVICKIVKALYYKLLSRPI